MKKIAKIVALVAAMAVALVSVQAVTAAAQDYTPNNPTVRAVYSPFRGEAPAVVDNAFGFGSLNPIAGNGPAAGGGDTGGSGSAGGAGGGLAHTGNEVTAPLAAAAALMGGGGLIVLASRDRD